jgi:hypothetical protein
MTATHRRMARIGPTAQNLFLRLRAAAWDNALDAEPPNADLPKRKRRWFQFSLRTLMIGVTLLCVLCAYVVHEARIVEARKLWIDGRPSSFDDPNWQRISWLRQLLGDYSMDKVCINSADELTQAKELFPEAIVLQMGTDGDWRTVWKPDDPAE